MHHRSTHFALLVLVVLAVSLVAGVGRAFAWGFAPHADFATANGTYAVATGDFNGDSRLDLVTGNTIGTISALLGDGDGGFASRTDTSGGDYQSVAVGDFNSDGKQDLVFPGKIMLGNGDSSFGVGTSFITGAGASKVAVADFNGDGKLDVVTSNSADSTVSILLGNGGGGFAAHTDFSTGTTPLSIAVADFNADGKLDIVTGNYTNTVSVLLGDGAGGFAAQTDFPVGGHSYSVTVGDFNSDGKPDVAAGNYGVATVSVLLGNGNGTLGVKTDFAVSGTNVNDVSVGDFNGDGKLDIVTANYAPNTVSVLRGDGAGSFAAKTDFPTGPMPMRLVVADFNGDGWPDLAVADYNSGAAGAASVSVLMNKGLGPAGTMLLAGGATAAAQRAIEIDSAVSGATQMRFRDLGGTWGAWQPYIDRAVWTLPAGDASKTVETQYRDAWGQTLSLSDAILLDSTAPSTTDDAPAGWQTSGVTVHLSPDDGSGSGVATTQYKLDAATSWSAGTSVAVGTDGTHTIRYRSTDAAGNKEDTEICTVKVDSTAPLTTAFGADTTWHVVPVMVLFSATDADSGVASTQYSTDGGASWKAGGGVLFVTDGDHEVRYRSSDAAGNVEVPKTIHIMIDTTAPVTTDNSDDATHSSFALALSPTDATSGVATTEYRIDGGAWQSGVSATLRRAVRHKRGGYSRGDHVVEYRSTDAAGNVETIESCTVKL